MRAKTIFSIVLSIALLFSASHSYAASPPRIGAVCLKVGSTQTFKGTKYTCIKNGKKLVWNKGAAVTKKNPTPILSPSIKPTPISSPELSKEVLFIESKLLEISKTLTQVPIPDFAVEVEPSDRNSLWANASIADVKTGIGLITALGGSLPSIPKLLVFSDFDWAKTRMSGSCLNWGMNSLGGQCASDVAFINLGWLKRNGYKPSEMSDPWLKMNLSSVLPSRLAHIAQSEVFFMSTGSYGTGDLNSIPAWMLMGKLQLFIVMNYSVATNTPYSKARAEWVKNWTKSCVNISLFDLSSTSPNVNGCDNINGYLAMELLLFKTGDLKAFYWWEAKASGVAPEGFKKSYGLDWDAFLRQADEYVKREYS